MPLTEKIVCVCVEPTGNSKKKKNCTLAKELYICSLVLDMVYIMSIYNGYYIYQSHNFVQYLSYYLKLKIANSKILKQQLIKSLILVVPKKKNMRNS